MDPVPNFPFSADTKPVEGPSNLDQLSINELQFRLEVVCEQHKEYERQRIRAVRAGHEAEESTVMIMKLANNLLLIKLGEALERKGIMF